MLNALLERHWNVITLFYDAEQKECFGSGTGIDKSVSVETGDPVDYMSHPQQTSLFHIYHRLPVLHLVRVVGNII